MEHHCFGCITPSEGLSWQTGADAPVGSVKPSALLEKPTGRGTMGGLWELRAASNLQPANVRTCNHVATEKWVLPTTQINLEVDSSPTSPQFRIQPTYCDYSLVRPWGEDPVKLCPDSWRMELWGDKRVLF